MERGTGGEATAKGAEDAEGWELLTFDRMTVILTKSVIGLFNLSSDLAKYTSRG